MSERLRVEHESHEIPAETNPEHLLPTPEQAEPLRKGEEDPAKRLEQARQEVEEVGEDGGQARRLEELHQEPHKAAGPAPGYVSSDLKKASLNRQLGSIRRSLGVSGRALSKVIHQPVIRAVSEPAGKTVSRPSGLLGGGMMAFIGTSAYLYLAKSTGMSYSYFVFIGLFIGGFLVGLILELLWHVLRRPRAGHDRS